MATPFYHDSGSPDSSSSSSSSSSSVSDRFATPPPSPRNGNLESGHDMSPKRVPPQADSQDANWPPNFGELLAEKEGDRPVTPPPPALKYSSQLHHVARDGRVEVASRLIERGADVNVRDDWDRSPLHATGNRGHDGVTSVLLANGADVRARDNYGRTPMHVAAKDGHHNVVRVLRMDGEAPLDDKDDWGRTALHLAARHGQTKAVLSLLNQGAIINALDDIGCTPLHLAAGFGHLDATQALLDAGADYEIREHCGNNAFDQAMKYNMRQAGLLLRDFAATAKANAQVESDDEDLPEVTRAPVVGMLEAAEEDSESEYEDFGSSEDDYDDDDDDDDADPPTTFIESRKRKLVEIENEGNGVEPKRRFV